MSRTIAPSELKALLAHGEDVVLLDVRRKNDFDADQVMLPDALWRDPEKITEWSASLPKDNDVVIYCVRGGSVSNAVVDRLREQGVSARFIEGGIEAWKNAGGATEQK